MSVVAQTPVVWGQMKLGLVRRLRNKCPILANHKLRHCWSCYWAHKRFSGQMRTLLQWLIAQFQFHFLRIISINKKPSTVKSQLICTSAFLKFFLFLLAKRIWPPKSGGKMCILVCVWVYTGCRTQHLWKEWGQHTHTQGQARLQLLEPLDIITHVVAEE